MESNTDKLIRLIKENPGLPVVPVVDGEIVGDDSYQYWLGHFGRSEVKGYYCQNRIRQKGKMMNDAVSRQSAIDARRYTFGNDEFSLEAAYHDCKLVFDGITDDNSFQEADTGLVLYYANEIIYALQEALEGKDTNVPTNDCISRQAAIDDLHTKDPSMIWDTADVEVWVNTLSSAQPEPLTDKEQRIFLAAMAREEKVCKQVDAECRDCREPYEDSLVRICHEIIRKVKGALWT